MTSCNVITKYLNVTLEFSDFDKNLVLAVVQVISAFDMRKFHLMLSSKKSSIQSGSNLGAMTLPLVDQQFQEGNFEDGIEDENESGSGVNVTTPSLLAPAEAINFFDAQFILHQWKTLRNLVNNCLINVVPNIKIILIRCIEYICSRFLVLLSYHHHFTWNWCGKRQWDAGSLQDLRYCKWISYFYFKKQFARSQGQADDFWDGHVILLFLVGGALFIIVHNYYGGFCFFLSDTTNFTKCSGIKIFRVPNNFRSNITGQQREKPLKSFRPSFPNCFMIPLAYIKKIFCKSICQRCLS